MADGAPAKFQLPAKIERILAFLASRYKEKGDNLMYRLLLSSSYEVFEGSHFQEWSGGGYSYGHDILFHVPPAIYSEMFDKKDRMASKLKSDINNASSVRNEHVEEVLFEITDGGVSEDWRETSDELPVNSAIAIADNRRGKAEMWTQGYLKLFLSHTAEYKAQASQLKEALDIFGVNCFVAHQDIEPTKEWQNQIEIALFTMDVLAALLTEDFPGSKWTDQEVGAAIGRRIPIVPVKLGIDPYGFIGKYQALPGQNKTIKVLTTDLYDLLWNIPAMHQRLIGGLITSFENSKSFDQSQSLMLYLNRIESAKPSEVDRLERAFEVNPQVATASRVQNQLPGLISRLRKISP